MKLLEHIILIPVYNDWKSLNLLLSEINKELDNKNNVKILIVNDYSTQKVDIKKNNFSKIKEIKILTLNQNLGSQKAIAIGLDYIKNLKKDFYITIMDGDGEDSPNEIKRMLKEAENFEDHVITSNRKERKESLLIKICYKPHLIITFLLTFKWISFGNFSCFHSNNLKKIFLNNNIWYAYSACIQKNCKFKRLFAKREKRYFDKSKINFLALVEHSLRVIGVFYNTVFLMSGIYLILFWFLPFKFSNLICLFIIIFNFLLIIIKIKHFKKEEINYINFKKSIEII